MLVILNLFSFNSKVHHFFVCFLGKLTALLLAYTLFFTLNVCYFYSQKKEELCGEGVEIHTSMCLLGGHSTNNNFIHLVMKLFGKYNPEWREMYKPCQKFYVKFEDRASFHFVCIIFLTQYWVFPNTFSCLFILIVKVINELKRIFLNFLLINVFI